jgi:hypothetical protein
VSSTAFTYEEAPIEEASERIITTDSPVKVIQSTIIKLNQLTTVSTYSPK